VPDPGSILAPLAVAGLLAVMLAFTFGTQRNIRKGNAVLAWLQRGLPLLGRRATLRWLGSSAVQLDIVEPVEPFREATCLVVLEPRDVPFLWLATRSRGRRDVLIIRGNLRRAPRVDLEAVDPAAWLVADDESDPEWTSIDLRPGVRASASTDPEQAIVGAVREAWNDLAAASGGTWRISIRRTVPHLQVHVRPPLPTSPPSDRLVSAVQQLARSLAGG
jgi:hypothetical protein